LDESETRNTAELETVRETVESPADVYGVILFSSIHFFLLFG
jgi:hypothetical protein